MYSEEVKLVFGFDPSGLFEKVIFAPDIGVPRTLVSPLELEDESEFEVTGSALVGVLVVFGFAGASVLGIFGILIFGSVNWATAGWLTNEVTAIAAIRISDDDLVMKHSPQNFKLGGQVGNILA